MARYITQMRRGTVEQWAARDTIIPKEGEIVIELDEVNSLHKLKIGDGIHAYADLAYLKAGDEIVTQVLAEAKPRVVTIELSDVWNQDAYGKYSQIVALDDITHRSRLDLQPTADMMAEFKQLGLVFVTENNGGTITVYSVGNIPTKSYVVQATIVETECDGEDECVIGIPVGASAVQSDWEQSDDTKADFIKNKPIIPSIEGLATETYVNEKVADIVNSAPETLDTLNELADALGDDPNFAATVATQIGQKADKTEIEDMLRYTAQTLTENQKAQVRENIGAATAGQGGSSGTVSLNVETGSYFNIVDIYGNPEKMYIAISDENYIQDAIGNYHLLKKGDIIRGTSDGAILISGLTVSVITDSTTFERDDYASSIQYSGAINVEFDLDGNATEQFSSSESDDIAISVYHSESGYNTIYNTKPIKMSVSYTDGTYGTFYLIGAQE